MSDPLLCSERDAARILGVSRDTLAELRRSGRVRVVPWPGRIGWRIPLEELQRVARQGATLNGLPTRPSRRQVRCANPAAAIRALDVEAL